MGLVHCPLRKCCHSEDQEPPSHSNSHHLLHSESSSTSSSSSSSSSLSSQPSLPSVPSLTSHSSLHQPQQPHLLTTLTSPRASPIFSLAIHAKFLYAASSNCHIRAWPRHPSSPSPHSHVVATPHGAVKSMVVSAHKLYTAHQDHRIRVWKIQFDDPNPKFKPLATLPTLGDRLSKLFSANNYVEVRRHKKCTWVHHVDTVSALALSHDASLLYSASWDRTFKIWRTWDFKCLESVKSHDDAINALVLSSDGVVYTGSADRKIKIWKKQEGEKNHSLLGTLEKHKSAVNALALSPDGSVLYSGACDRSILVWEKDGNNDGGTMVLVGALRGHTKAILCLVAMEDLVCSGSADNSVRIWRRGLHKNYSCISVLQGHRKPVKCLAMAVDSNKTSSDNGGSHTNNTYLVYSGSLDCDIKVWKIHVPLF